MSGSYWYMIRTHAFVRDLPFEITIEDAWAQFEKQKGRCALSGDELRFARNYRDHKRDQTASLDRRDSSRGYTLDNIQWVHKDLNNMKQHYSQQEFLDWCKKVVEHNTDNDVPLEQAA